MSTNEYVILAYGLGLAVLLGYGAILLVSLARLGHRRGDGGEES